MVRPFPDRNLRFGRKVTVRAEGMAIKAFIVTLTKGGGMPFSRGSRGVGRDGDGTCIGGIFDDRRLGGADVMVDFGYIRQRFRICGIE
jgi:hypothetical protein